MHNDSDDSSDAADYPVHDAYAAIRIPSYRRYWTGNVLSILGRQMQTVTVVWEVYSRTGNTFDVGLVGLVQVIPVLSLALVGGHVADRVNRKLVVAAAMVLSIVSSLGLAAVSFYQWHIAGTYASLALLGVSRAFLQPAKNSLVPQLVPRSIFSNAVTWNLGGFQLASVAGPALGGWALAAFGHAWGVYLVNVAAAAVFLLLLLGVKPRSKKTDVAAAPTLRSLGEGVSFVWNHPIILGAISLDMFAVLLGGAKALLPVFATEILGVGPAWYGWLYAAEALGALSMSLALMHRPPIAKAGRSLLLSVAAYGVAIFVFGISRSFMLSFVALFCTGAFDCISVVIRHTLVQMLTPDRMRGRVSAISGMFVSTSNEMGEFESGTLARLTSPVFAVVFGGIGTLVVVLFVALRNPRLRRYGRLDGRDSPHDDAPPAPSAPDSASPETTPAESTR
ncbi:MAG: MFS transporter [Planctomycetota bacterium]|nr:MAG: MFS transporter [Planctomycetota bacterium]